MPAITVTCRGARGSVPVSGPQFARYGGATTCFEIRMATDHRLLVDLGTGALSLHDELPEGSPLHFSVLFTHLHWDHTLALPFLKPLYSPQSRFDFYGQEVGGMGIEEALDRVMRPPWFPVSFRSTPAHKRFHHLDGSPFRIEDIDVTPARLHHPDGVTAYRFERDGASLVIATDIEHGDPAADQRLLELCRGTDALVSDAQYLPAEYEREKVGWGHSTWRSATTLAEAAGVGHLYLTSHDPARTDEQIDEILTHARDAFPRSDMAREGMTITVG